VIKLHAVSRTSNNSYPERDSHHYVLAHNTLVGGNNDWSVAVGPQNATNEEVARTGIIEANHFVAGSGTQVHLILWAQDQTVRNNIFDMTGGSGSSGVRIARRGIEPPPANNRVYNNTCYRRDSDNGATCVSSTGSASNSTSVNNLIYAPATSSPDASTGAQVERNNLVATSNPFVVSQPKAPADFRLASGSAAIDAGMSPGAAIVDFTGGTRPARNGFDVGAFEFGATNGTPPPTNPPPASQPPAAPVLLP
jgi:hypothetical protein